MPVSWLRALIFMRLLLRFMATSRVAAAFQVAVTLRAGVQPEPLGGRLA